MQSNTDYKSFTMKPILLLISVLICGQMSMAQNTDQRSTTTKIADLLMLVPAQDAQRLRELMHAMDALDADGLLELAQGLKPRSEGSSAAVEYALNSYSMYLSSGKQPAEIKEAIQAYSKALENGRSTDNKTFFIRQLQQIGAAESVPVLAEYLNQDSLAAPVANALAGIGTEAAHTVLVSQLQSSNNPRISKAIVGALGYAGYAGALDAITQQVQDSRDAEMQKLGLYALAQIADPSSASLLQAAAAAQAYTYDPTDAMASYLMYLENLEDSALALKQAKQVYKAVQERADPALRASTLALLVRLDLSKRRKYIRQALNDPDAAYRAGALTLVSDAQDSLLMEDVVKHLGKGDPATQASLIAFVGRHRLEAAFPAIAQIIEKDKAPRTMRSSAIVALAETGKAKALPIFFNLLKQGDAEDIKAVSQALKIIDAPEMGTQIAQVLPDMESPGKIALMQILAYRGMSPQFDSVLPYLKDTEPALRAAAFKSIEKLATPKHIPQLFNLLNQSVQDAEVSALQSAIIYALAQEERHAATTTILAQLEKAPEHKQTLYYPLLASTGGKEALEAVSQAYQEGNTGERDAAAHALAAWSDASVLPILYHIASQTTNKQQLDAALKALVRLATSQDFPVDQQVILLKDAMELAESPAQGRLILSKLSACTTFPALFFAGQYLEDPQLKQSAAHAVIEIALTDASYFYGKEVERLLQQTLIALEGRDSEYLREAIRKHIDEMPKETGFVPLFNAKDLSGWKGLVANPLKRANMTEAELSEAQKEADAAMHASWVVEDGNLIFTGKGDNIATTKAYGDIELLVDWKIYDDGQKNGDAGIYLRGSPQVQIWDTARVEVGAQVGSGGLYNNQVHESKPLQVADNALGRWNNFHIKMQGDRVTVYLNGVLVTDSVVMENYWDRDLPIFAKEQIELQAHGSKIAYRDIYIREMHSGRTFELSSKEQAQGFQVLFDGSNLDQWIGNKTAYTIEDGTLIVQPTEGSGGNLFTKDTYGDFIFRMDFKLTPGANNGLGIRAPLEGDAAYEGMELQILDDTADIYKNLEAYQYHGSIYGIEAAKKGYLKPMGEWNHQEVIVQGPKIQVILNGTQIVDADITESRKHGAKDGKPHPGLHKTQGHIGFLGHGSKVYFRNIRIKDLSR